MSSLVSVILPVYNCEKHLEKAIRSVVEQTAFESVELILVDDGSTDSSAAICDRFAREFTNIVAVHQKNSGVSAARNHGMKRAKGEYLTFIDSDDMYEKSYIREMLRHRENDLVCCDYYIKNRCEKNLGRLFESGCCCDFDNSFFKKVIQPEFYSCWNKFFKKSLVEKNGVRFPVGVKYAEDMVFVLEYLRHCKSFYFVENPLYFYNVNPENTTSVVKNGFAVQKGIFEYQKNYFKGNAELIDAVSSLLVFKSLCCINSDITYGSVFDGLKSCKKILSDSDFYENFIKEDYSEPKCKYDKVFFRLIKMKCAFLIVLWRKLFDLRSLLAHE